jgi:aspartate racemase
MKTLGLLGGMSWESTLVYYRLLNEGVARRRGGLHSAPLLIHSVDFAPIARLQQAGDWAAAGQVLGEAARGLRAAGAQGLLIATHTMHLVASAVQDAAGLPLLHIADAAIEALKAQGHRRVGLLGTRFTMEQPLLREHYAGAGIEVVVPEGDDRELVHRVIFEELCRGLVRDASRAAYQRIVEALAALDCSAVLLACTEICLLLPPGTPCALPMFDTTALHAAAAVHWMCEEEKELR